jgi:cell division inhibitor SulA
MVKHSDPFKKETKWRQWRESMQTHSHSKVKHAGLPLAYIIQEQDVPNYDKLFNTVHDQLVECAILTGPEYNINNGLVYNLLQ